MNTAASQVVQHHAWAWSSTGTKTHSSPQSAQGALTPLSINRWSARGYMSFTVAEHADSSAQDTPAGRAPGLRSARAPWGTREAEVPDDRRQDVHRAALDDRAGPAWTALRAGRRPPAVARVVAVGGPRPRAATHLRQRREWRRVDVRL